MWAELVAHFLFQKRYVEIVWVLLGLWTETGIYADVERRAISFVAALFAEGPRETVAIAERSGSISQVLMIHDLAWGCVSFLKLMRS